MNAIDVDEERLHLAGPYAVTLCCLSLQEARNLGAVWPKGSWPEKDRTCEQCWSTATSIFGEAVLADAALRAHWSFVLRDAEAEPAQQVRV